MAASTAFIDELLNLIFLNDNIDNLGDATGVQASTGAGVIQMAIHTADPLVGGNLSTSEVTYTGYARPTPDRTSDWTVATGTASNAAVEQFGNKTGGGDQTATHGSIGANTGTEMYLFGALASPLTISNGVNPQYAISAADFTLT